MRDITCGEEKEVGGEDKFLESQILIFPSDIKSNNQKSNQFYDKKGKLEWEERIWLEELTSIDVTTLPQFTNLIRNNEVD